MSFRRSLRAGIAAIGLTAAAPAHADTFNLTLSGVHLGTATLSAKQSDGEYVAVSKVTPSMLVNAMTSYSFEGRASGWVDAAGKVTPGAFEADSSSPRATRRTEIEWEGDTPVRVSVDPPRKRAPDPARVIGALDPVSAAFALLRDAAPEKICDTSVDVYDGSRRSRLSIGKPAAASGGGYSCSGTYARLEGEAHSLSSQDSYPFTLSFVPAGDGRVRIERIETRTRFGPAVISRRG